MKARSSCPSRRRSTSTASSSASNSRMSSCGRSAFSTRITDGTTLTVTLWKVPTTSRPPSPARSWPPRPRPGVSWRKTDSAWARTTRPTGVSSTGRGPPGRSKTGAPTTRSSAAICWLMADCVKPSRSPARPNDRSAATARSATRWRISRSRSHMSISIGDDHESYQSLDFIDLRPYRGPMSLTVSTNPDLSALLDDQLDDLAWAIARDGIEQHESAVARRRRLPRPTAPTARWSAIVGGPQPAGRGPGACLRPPLAARRVADRPPARRLTPPGRSCRTESGEIGPNGLRRHEAHQRRHPGADGDDRREGQLAPGRDGRGQRRRAAGRRSPAAGRG